MATAVLDDTALREAIEALVAKERRVAQLENASQQSGLLQSGSSASNGKAAALPQLSAAGAAALARAPHNAFNQPLGRSPSSGGFGLASDASALMQAVRQRSQNGSEPLRVTPELTPATASLCRHVPWDVPSSGVLQASGLPLAPLQLEILRNRSFGRTGLSLASSGLVELEGGLNRVHEHLQEIPLLLAPSGDVPITLLDLSHNGGLGLLSAGAVVEVLRRCNAVHTLMLAGNPWGGSLGVAGLLRAASLLPRLRHFGISVSDRQTGSPASIAQLKRDLGAKEAAASSAAALAAAYAAGASASSGRGGRGGASAAGRGGRGGAKAGAKGKGGGAGADGAAGPSDVDPTIEGVGTEEAGTAWHLCAALKSGAIRLRSLSVSGSSLSRAAAAVLFASCAEAPPSSSASSSHAGSSSGPADATLAAAAAGGSSARGGAAAVVARGGGRGGAAAAAAKPGAGRGGAAAGTSAGAAPPAVPGAGSTAASSSLLSPSQLDASEDSRAGSGSGPMVSLDLSRTLLGALSVLDLSIALAPAPPQGSDKAAETSSLIRALVAEEEALGPSNWSSSLMAGAGAGTGGASAAGGSRGGSGSSSSFAAVLSSSLTRLPGSLNALRCLNLSQCGLSTAAIRPLLEVVASGQASSLQVLNLRGNHIDDEGAGLLAECITMNAAKLALPAAEAASFFASTASAATLSAAAKSSQQAAGLQAALSLSPLRVIDIRNNPLYLSEQGDGTSHDGCRMLLEAFAGTPSLLTLTGPEPSAEGLNGWNKSIQAIIFEQQLAAATAGSASAGGTSATMQQLHAVANRHVSSVFGPSSGVGIGPAFPVDLLALLQAAERVYCGDVTDTTSGSFNTASALANVTGGGGSGNIGRLGLGAMGEGRSTASASLDAPHGLAHALARITIERIRGVLKGAAEACFGSYASNTGPGNASSSSGTASLLAPSTALAEAQALLQASQSLTVVVGKAPHLPLAAAVMAPAPALSTSAAHQAPTASHVYTSAVLASLDGGAVANGNIASAAAEMGLDADPLVLQQGFFLHPLHRVPVACTRPHLTAMGASLTAVPLRELLQADSPSRFAPLSQLQAEHHKVQLSLASVAPGAASSPSSSRSGVRLEWCGGMRACVEVTVHGSSASTLTPGALVAMVSRYKLVWTVLAAADYATAGSPSVGSAAACDGSTFSQHSATVIAVRSQHATASHDRSHARARGELADSACFTVAMSESGVDGFTKGWSKDAGESSLAEAVAYIAGGYKPAPPSAADGGFGGQQGDNDEDRREHFGRLALDSLVQVSDAGPSSSSRDWVNAAGLHEPTLLAVEHVREGEGAGRDAASSAQTQQHQSEGGGLTLRCLLSWPAAWQSVDITSLVTPAMASASSGTKLVLMGQLVNGSPPDGMKETPSSASERLLAQVLPPPPAIKVVSATVSLATAEVVASGSAANSALKQLALLSYTKAPTEDAASGPYYVGSAENDIMASLQF